MADAGGGPGLANALALYLGYFWPGATEGVGRALVLTATIVGLAAINFVGVRYGSWTVNFFTIGKLLPLAIFILLGFFFIDGERFTGFQQMKLEGFGQAILLLIFAYGGYELISVPAGEAQSPRAHVPQALLMTIGVAGTIFCLVQVVAVGTLPGLTESETPLADAAALFLGPLGGTLIALGGLISIAGANSGSMLAAPRMTFALGEGGQLPGVFAHVHGRFRGPSRSWRPPARWRGWCITPPPAPRFRCCGANKDRCRTPGSSPGARPFRWADARSLKFGVIALVVGAGFYGLQRLRGRKDR